MPPKKPSGSEFKKLREARKDKEQKLSNRLFGWISNSSNLTVVNEGSGSASSSMELGLNINVNDTLTITSTNGNERDFTQESQDLQRGCSLAAEAEEGTF